jgi:hypothetical protein
MPDHPTAPEQRTIDVDLDQVRADGNTLRAAEFLAMQDAEERVGATDFLPEGLTILRAAQRVSPRG